MKFCDDCGSLLQPNPEKCEKGQLWCRRCEKPIDAEGTSYRITTKPKDCKHDELIIMRAGEDRDTRPKVKEVCPKCDKIQVCYAWEIQTRSADEAPTRFYQCTSCDHSWREYD